MRKESARAPASFIQNALLQEHAKLHHFYGGEVIFTAINYRMEVSANVILYYHRITKLCGFTVQSQVNVIIMIDNLSYMIRYNYT